MFSGIFGGLLGGVVGVVVSILFVIAVLGGLLYLVFEYALWILHQRHGYSFMPDGHKLLFWKLENSNLVN